MMQSLILPREESGCHMVALVKKITLRHPYWYEGVDAALLTGCLSSVQKSWSGSPALHKNWEGACTPMI